MKDLKCTAFVNGLLGTFILLMVSMAPSVFAQTNDDNQVLEEVVVQGIRKSIDNAMDIKRESDTVVDAITAIDIGQFADDSIAGAMMRIPGVQIEFNDDGTAGDRASIRGMGPQFVNTTVNGRVLLSAGTEGTNLRSANLDVFPSTILSGVQVVKAQTAMRPESGIAGQVDLQTLRPLDVGQLQNKTYFGSASLRGEYQDVSDDSGWRADAILAFRNSDSTIGGYIAVVEGDYDTARDQARVNSAIRSVKINTDGVPGADVTITGVRAPSAATYNPIREDRGRSAFAGALQFKPNDDVNIVADLTYSKFDLQSTRQRMTTGLGGAYSGVFDADSIVIDENNVLQYADYSGLTGGGTLVPSFAALTYDNVTENLVGGINVDWAARDNLDVNFDLYYSDIEYDQLLVQSINRIVLNAANGRGNIIYDTSSGIPQVTFGPEFLDASGYTYFRSAVRQINLQGDNVGTNLELNFKLDNNVLSAIQAGVHYDVSNINKRMSNNKFYNFPGAANAALNREIAAASLSAVPFSDIFLSAENVLPNQWLVVDAATIAEYDPRVLTRGFGEDELGVALNASYKTEETNFSYFAQADIDSKIRDMPLTGNIGIRAVNIDVKSHGHAIGSGLPEPVPVTVSDDYWEYLPSLNLRLEPNESMALRFAAARTMTRPEFEEQAPIINVISLPDPVEGTNGRATLGNVALKPILSTNFDLTFEWYNKQGGSVVFSLFYKDVSGFIVRESVEDATLPGFDGLFNVTQPINYTDGTINGAEIGFYQPFANGFGIQANYTYIDSKFDKDVGDAGHGFPGASKDNFNFGAFYENPRFSARVAYVYRGDFFRALAGAGAQTPDAIFTQAQHRLDLNLRVRFLKRMTLSFNVINLTNETGRDYIGSQSTFLNLFERGRKYSLTATYRF